MAYIDKANESPNGESGAAGCIFCDKPAADRDVENLIVHRGRNAFGILNLYPYNNGHMMIVPYGHTASLDDLDSETLLEIMHLVAISQRVLAKAFGPHGYNVGMNFGRVAGAGIADHLHMHIVPRWNGDANFMTVIGETRVLPESLEVSYRKIKDAWPADE